jgi:nitrogen regulatory protein PII
MLTAGTGSIGDGKLFVIPVSWVVCVCMGETDQEALMGEEPAVLSDPIKKK